MRCTNLLFSAPLFGADQAEDKKFKAPNNITGPLLVLSHVVQQAYFPHSARETLSFFLSKSVVVMQLHSLLLWVWTTAACLGCIPYHCLLLWVCCVLSRPTTTDNYKECILGKNAFLTFSCGS